MTTDPPVDPRAPTLAPPVSPAARERVIAVLTERYAQDHLTLDEFERRAAAAYAARSPDELAVLTSDLPHGEVPTTRASLPAGNVGVVLGSIVRDMHAVPRALGDIEIQLPPHVGVEDHVSAVLGSFEYRRHPRASSWVESSKITSVVRFTGRVTMSSAEVVIRNDIGSDGQLLEE